MPKNTIILTPYKVYLNLKRLRRRLRDLEDDLDALLTDMEDFARE